MNLLTRYELVLPLKTQICSPVWIPLLPQSLQLVYECLGMIRCYSSWKVTVAPLATWLIALATFLALWLHTSCLFSLRRAHLFHGPRLYQRLEVLEKNHYPKDAKYAPNLVPLMAFPASCRLSVKLLAHCLTSHNAVPLGTPIIVGLYTLKLYGFYMFTFLLFEDDYARPFLKEKNTIIGFCPNVPNKN